MSSTSPDVKLRRERNRRIVDEIRNSTPCADCGVQFPAHAMDFDHFTGEKIANVMDLVYKPAGLAVLWAEINKCVVVCALCHRYRTHARKQAA